MVKTNEFDLDLNIKQSSREDVQPLIANISVCTGVCILDNREVYITEFLK